MGTAPYPDAVLEIDRELKRLARLRQEDLHSACMTTVVAWLRNHPRAAIEDPDSSGGRLFRQTPAFARLERSVGPRHFEGRVAGYLDDGEVWLAEEQDRVLAHYARVIVSPGWASAVERQRLLFKIVCAAALVGGPAVQASYRDLASALDALGAGEPGPPAVRKAVLATQSRGWLHVHTGRSGIPGTGVARKTVLDLKPLLEPATLTDEERDALRLRLPDLAYVLLGLPVPGQTPCVKPRRPRVAPAPRRASPPRVPHRMPRVAPVRGSLTRGQDLLVGALTGLREGTGEVYIAPLGALHVRARPGMITRRTSPEIEKREISPAPDPRHA